MARLVERDEIEAVLPGIDLVGIIEEGFVRYSRGEVVVPPVGEMLFDNPPGDVHIKYGYIRNAEHYVIKIASGFYDNIKLGLPSTDGMMLVFKQATGQLDSILLDNGYLTTMRTAAAGAVAAKHLAPRNVERIGIIGAGQQARAQVRLLKEVTDCREAMVCGQNRDEADLCAADMRQCGFSVETATHASEVAAQCNLIVTVTPSKTPLLYAADIRPGTHITAIGSDTPEKQELDCVILARADIVVTDSLAQCVSRGEIYKALEAGAISKSSVVELGQVISDSNLRRTSDEQITVADLTGLAVQDIQIATAVCRCV